MKNMNTKVMAAVVAMSAGVAGAVPSKTVTLNQIPQAMYAPMGFDDNDNAQVTFEGYYANTCYKVGPTTHTIDADKKTITVENKTYFTPNAYCLMMIVPYTKTLDLGRLTPGAYKVQFADAKGSAQVLGVLNVKPATTPDQDEHLYLPVDKAYMVRGDAPGSYKLVMNGRITDSCMKAGAIEAVRESDSVIAVLPFAVMTGTGADCKPVNEAFTVEKVFTGLKGKVLFHVRSLNGNAINQIYEFPNE